MNTSGQWPAVSDQFLTEHRPLAPDHSTYCSYWSYVASWISVLLLPAIVASVRR